jgi:hypothetical protein
MALVGVCWVPNAATAKTVEPAASAHDPSWGAGFTRHESFHVGCQKINPDPQSRPGERSPRFSTIRSFTFPHNQWRLVLKNRLPVNRA